METKVAVNAHSTVTTITQSRIRKMHDIQKIQQTRCLKKCTAQNAKILLNLLMRKFCGNILQFLQSFERSLCRKNFHTKKLVKIAVFYAGMLMLNLPSSTSAKCFFKELNFFFALQLYRNRTSAWVFAFKFCCKFSKYIFLRTPLRNASELA